MTFGRIMERELAVACCDFENENVNAAFHVAQTDEIAGYAVFLLYLDAMSRTAVVNQISRHYELCASIGVVFF